MPIGEMKSSPSFGCSKDSTSSQTLSPSIGRLINGKWSPIIGHGCHTKTQMIEWCRSQNQQAGSKIFKVIDDRPKSSSKRKSRRLPLTKLEQEICELTLGLLKKKSAIQNSFIPSNDPERFICKSLADRGYMKFTGANYCLTASGIHALSRKRSISFGVVG
jgi:hypothetical protein